MRFVVIIVSSVVLATFMRCYCSCVVLLCRWQLEVISAEAKIETLKTFDLADAHCWSKEDEAKKSLNNTFVTLPI
jgi:hypothetical protein